MKKIIVSLLFAIPFVSAFAQETVEINATVVDSVATDSVVDPMARFQGRTMVDVYNEGVKHQRKRDFAQALPCFQYAADQGNADAQYRTAYIYHYGNAGRKDDDMAIKYWIMASDQSHGQSQFELGFLYYKLEDYANAVKYWELSVDNGYSESMSNIGVCYDQGLGVDCDEEKALSWFSRAAENGDKTAMHNIGQYYEQGKGGLPVDIEKAIEWYSKAWELGHYNSKVALERIQSQQ